VAAGRERKPTTMLEERVSGRVEGEEHPMTAMVRRLIASKNDALLGHRYFKACRGNELGKAHLIEIVKQLYCFSVFFERLLTRRISDYPSQRDPRVLRIARDHLREEIGHAELFHDCLRSNGVSEEEIVALTPKMFTKAMFGYLMTTLQYENEYVANIAIMQVMESIGFHFFSETLGSMRKNALAAEALFRHTEDDERHPELGLELVATFDAATMSTCVRIIDDVYRLMAFVLDEWLGLEPASGSVTRRRRSTRPPKAN
jgi:pyrroloquinoline quinone (PQQ) biosynthesis protein C